MKLIQKNKASMKKSGVVKRAFRHLATLAVAGIFVAACGSTQPKKVQIASSGDTPALAAPEKEPGALYLKENPFPEDELEVEKKGSEVLYLKENPFSEEGLEAGPIDDNPFVEKKKNLKPPLMDCPY